MNEEGIGKDVWGSVAVAAARLVGTPCFAFSWDHVVTAVRELDVVRCSRPVRHLLSLKTQPLRRLVRQWYESGGNIEVVSEFELLAALREGFPPERIVVNGPGKLRWLSAFDVRGLRVHFDSPREAEILGARAKEHQWHVGLRLQVAGQADPDESRFVSQFGLSTEEVPRALRSLSHVGVESEGVHFHLHSDLAVPEDYETALSSLADICIQNNIAPHYVDCGGGFPSLSPTRAGNAGGFRPAALQAPLEHMLRMLPTTEEVWFENGKFLLERAGILVLRVIDIKDRRECRYLICDGGRTNHALVSDWEQHEVFTIPDRIGQRILTTIAGPTCMAYDRLCRIELPTTIAIGDLVVWMNAGAYHLPWETKFSHGLAPVVWIHNGELSVVRERETFDGWWTTYGS